MPNKKPLISVIITSKNEAGVIEKNLKSLKRQTYKNIEVIVVDNHSSDTTVAITKKFTNKVYTFGPERSAQRNFGVRKAKGEYLLFLDADMELTPNVISQCVSKNAEAVFIPEQSIGHYFWEKAKAFERSFYIDSDNHQIESARFFSRKAFLRAGGYDETITGPEDWDLSEAILKLGYKSAKISALIYHHERIKSLWSQAQKFYFYGLRAHRTLSRQPSIFSSKTLYFLRPEFYRQWPHLLAHPILSLGMIILLVTQAIGGGLGYLVGVIKNV